MATGYRNPIIPGFNPDPTIICVGDDYFLATSTFEYFPGVPIYHSKDLTSWELIGHALNRPTQLTMRSPEAGGGIYAPTLRHHNGRFYMITTCNHRMSQRAPHETRPGVRGFFVWTDDIFDETKWSEPVFMDLLGIDQDLFFDDDGQVYQAWAAHRPNVPLFPSPGVFNLSVYGAKIDIATGDTLSEPVLLRFNPATGNQVSEGPHIFKRGNYYYLITADGGTEVEHQEWVQRSDVSPLGPWEVGPKGVNPMVFNDDDPYVQQTGHMDMVEGHDGRWWAVFLAVRNHNGNLSQLGRETFLAPVEWVNDWPIVNGGKRITVDGDPSVGLARISPAQSWSYDFTADTNLTKEGFYNLRTPQKAFHSLVSHPGSLAIRGGPFRLEQDESVTMLLKKQTAFTGEWTADVAFQPLAESEEAGVTVWWSKWCYASFTLRGKAPVDGSPVPTELVFRRPDDGDGFTETVFPSSGPAVSVRVVAARDGYTFYATQEGGKEIQVGTIEATALVRTRPWDSPFTGTFLGLFAQGKHGHGCRSPAVFSKFTWNSNGDE